MGVAERAAPRSLCGASAGALRRSLSWQVVIRAALAAVESSGAKKPIGVVMQTATQSIMMKCPINMLPRCARCWERNFLRPSVGREAE